MSAADGIAGLAVAVGAIAFVFAWGWVIGRGGR